MNWERFAGICRQFAESINETLGELTCDPLRAEEGRRGQMIGKNRQRNENEKQESERQMRDFQHRNRNWLC